MSLRFRRPSSTPWKTVALEIVEGLGKAVVLIASTVAVVVLGIVLAAMSSLP
jgi:hypothetical protein